MQCVTLGEGGVWSEFAKWDMGRSQGGLKSAQSVKYYWSLFRYDQVCFNRVWLYFMSVCVCLFVYVSEYVFKCVCVRVFVYECRQMFLCVWAVCVCVFVCVWMRERESLLFECNHINQIFDMPQSWKSVFRFFHWFENKTFL